MPLNSIAPILPANDVLETVRWYEVKLGFQRRFVYTEPPYAVIARDGVEIHLSQFKIDAKRNYTTCYIRVKGVDALYETWRVQGLIHPSATLETKPWGQKEFAIADPNGNLLRFGEAA
jgi:uncharacterized glyoxalase superfamily protein PhnB